MLVLDVKLGVVAKSRAKLRRLRKRSRLSLLLCRVFHRLAFVFGFALVLELARGIDNFRLRLGCS